MESTDKTLLELYDDLGGLNEAEQERFIYGQAISAVSPPKFAYTIAGAIVGRYYGGAGGAGTSRTNVISAAAGGPGYVSSINVSGTITVGRGGNSSGGGVGTANSGNGGNAGSGSAGGSGVVILRFT